MRDAPVDYGPPKTIYNRFIRWSRMGVFNRIFVALAAKDTLFTAAWGNDRITNSINEYAGWVKQAEAAHATAKYAQVATAE